MNDIMVFLRQRKTMSSKNQPECAFDTKNRPECAFSLFFYVLLIFPTPVQIKNNTFVLSLTFDITSQHLSGNRHHHSVQGITTADGTSFGSTFKMEKCRLSIVKLQSKMPITLPNLLFMTSMLRTGRGYNVGEIVSARKAKGELE